jgi:hypothetical protein
MRISIWICASLASVLLAMASPSFAHHSVTGQFDPEQRLELNGVISKIDWVNPHIYIHLDVENDAGEAETWRLETVPPAFLYRAQVTEDMLRGSGKPVRIEALRGRDQSQNLGFILKIHYAEGHHYQLSAERF